MNLKSTCSTRRASGGSILFATLVVIGITGLALASYMSLLQSRMKLSARSQSWNLAIPVAEAGIEEAMAHLVSSAGDNLASNGWTLATPDSYQKQVTIDSSNAYFVVSISTNSPPVVRSEGFVRNSGSAQYLSRIIKVRTTNFGLWKGLMVQQGITMASGCSVDSYDSSNPLYSTNGMYAAAKASEKGLLGTTSITSNAAAINGKIIGNVDTGASDVLKLTSPGVVGNKVYVNNAANAGTVQSGHLDPAYKASFPPVSVPFTGGYLAPGGGTYNGTNYTYLLTGGNYQAAAMSAANIKILVTADTTLYLTDKFHMLGGGLLEILPGAKLKLYVANSFKLIGTSLVNPNGKPDQFSYYGLPANTVLNLEDDSVLVGTLYAPSANAQLRNDAVLSGAGIFLKTVIEDSFKFHFDQAVGGGTGGTLQIVSWTEL